MAKESRRPDQEADGGPKHDEDVRSQLTWIGGGGHAQPAGTNSTAASPWELASQRVCVLARTCPVTRTAVTPPESACTFG
jgi:hypothetical protein